MREKIIAGIITAFALIPTSVITFWVTANHGWWTYLVLLFGAGAFALLYSRSWLSVKALLVFIFISCFVSRAPYLSFTAFMVLTSCFIFYIHCLKINTMQPIFLAARSVFYLTVVMVCMQQFGVDKLLNFGRNEATYISVLGNPMMAGTFIVCLAPLLLLESKWYLFPLLLMAFLFKSAGTFLSLGAGIMVFVLYALRRERKIQILVVSLAMIATTLYAFKSGNVFQFKYQDRWPAWKKTIQLANERPYLGHGIGTYRVIVPALMTLKDAGGTTDKWEYLGTTNNVLAWRQAHNFFLQILFEAGYMGLGFVLWLIGLTLWRLWRSKDITLIAGASMLIVNMGIHFPDRMVQTTLLLILFMALCHKRGEEWRLQH